MAKSVSHISLSGNEKISLITNLSTMLRSGIPILEAVDSLLEDTKSNQRKILETLKTDLMQGKRVYTSLAQFPETFDLVTVNLIKASEEAGTLETTLADLRIHIQKDMEFSDKIKGALIYPAVIMCVFAGVILMILIVVIPKISTVFSRMNVKLPLPTQIMISVSGFMLNKTWYFIGILILIFTLIFYLVTRQKKFLIKILTSFPIVANLVKEIDLTRLTRNLYLLLSAGLPITTALELSRDVVVRQQMARLIDKSREMIMSGKRFSDGLKSTKGAIPSIMIKLIEAGEKSGTLDKSLLDISEFIDYQVSNTLKNLTALLEPVLLLFVAIGVGGMMVAIIAPIYGLISQVGGH
jgi:type II secretory pathway component PulF